MNSGLMREKNLETVSQLSDAQTFLIKAQDELLACYRSQQVPSEKLLSDIEIFRFRVKKFETRKEAPRFRMKASVAILKTES